MSRPHRKVRADARHSQAHRHEPTTEGPHNHVGLKNRRVLGCGSDRYLANYLDGKRPAYSLRFMRVTLNDEGPSDVF